MLKDIFGVENADDLIEIIMKYRITGETFIGDDRNGFIESGGGRDRRKLRAGNHDFLDLDLFKLNNAAQHLMGVIRDHPGLTAGINYLKKLLFCRRAFLLPLKQSQQPVKNASLFLAQLVFSITYKCHQGVSTLLVRSSRNLNFRAGFLRNQTLFGE